MDIELSSVYLRYDKIWVNYIREKGSKKLLYTVKTKTPMTELSAKEFIETHRSRQ